MNSKKLDSILNQVPSATAKGEEKRLISSPSKHAQETEEIVKIVARIPLSLKEEIRQFLKLNKEDTESTVVLKGLKKMGFKIDPKWTIDRRKLR